jgi:hypothetical protein
MIAEWPEGSAGLQTGCRAGVHARIGPGYITKSHGLGTDKKKPTLKCILAFAKDICAPSIPRLRA